jgi:hypothetical protein
MLSYIYEKNVSELLSVKNDMNIWSRMVPLSCNQTTIELKDGGNAKSIHNNRDMMINYRIEWEGMSLCRCPGLR